MPDLREVLAGHARSGGVRAFLESHLTIDAATHRWPVIADVTVGCNLACTMCFNSERVRREFAGDAVLRAFETEVLPLASEIAFGCRHEALLHPQLPQLLATLRQAIDHQKRETRLCVLTSGTLLEASLAERLLAARPHDLLLSIDSADPQTFAAIRKPATWPQLRRLLAPLPALARQHGVNLAVQMVLLRATLPHMASSVAAFADLGIENVHVSQAAWWPSQANTDILTFFGPQRAEIEAEMARAKQVAEQRGVHLQVPDLAPQLPAGETYAVRAEGNVWDEQHLKREHPAVCTAPWSKLRIDHAGNVFPCQFILHAGSAWGNVLQTPLAQIVNGPRARAMREAMLAGVAAVPGCARCPYGPVA